MTTQSFAKFLGAFAALVAVVVASVSIKAPRARANDGNDDSRVRIGFQIAPLALDLRGKDREKVGSAATWSTLSEIAMAATPLEDRQTSITRPGEILTSISLMWSIQPST